MKLIALHSRRLIVAHRCSLELVKNDFQRAGAGGMGMGAGKGKGKGKGQGKGMGGLRIKKVTYFVNFELNRRFEAAKIALAQQGRDDTEQTCVIVKLSPVTSSMLMEPPTHLQPLPRDSRGQRPAYTGGTPSIDRFHVCHLLTACPDQDGFRVGGVDGARIVNGKAYGLGVYLARDPFLSMGCVSLPYIAVGRSLTCPC